MANNAHEQCDRQLVQERIARNPAPQIQMVAKQRNHSPSGSVPNASESGSINKVQKASSAQKVDDSASSKQISASERGESSNLAKLASAAGDMDLVEFIESAENSLRNVQREMRQIDREFHKKMRELESQKFSAKKSHFETRKNIISANHKDFWQKMFLYNPEIEMHLNIDSKSEEVEHCDLDIIAALKSIEVESSVSSDHYETKMIMHLDPSNKYIENTELVRLIKTPLDHLPHDDSVEVSAEAQDQQTENKQQSDSITVETTELKPKPALIELNEKLEKDNVNFGLAPFIVQFVNKDYPIMNQFVESMKQVYSNPIYSLKSGLEEESNYQMEMDSDELDEEEEEEENELSEVDEEAEDEE